MSATHKERSQKPIIAKFALSLFGASASTSISSPDLTWSSPDTSKHDTSTPKSLFPTSARPVALPSTVVMSSATTLLPLASNSWVSLAEAWLMPASTTYVPITDCVVRSISLTTLDVTCSTAPPTTEVQRRECWSCSIPSIFVSSIDSSTMERTRVEPIKVMTRYLSNAKLAGSFNENTPFSPGKSCTACSLMPIPVLITRRDPSENAPQHATIWSCPCSSGSASTASTMGPMLVKVSITSR
mmetsp:Transcript_42525/g.109318  ORF Transcript_42525/g.109318 Transcript_42525/m.109318 type:complete len:242 (-) Transcript_42525:1080-1805(-)